MALTLTELVTTHAAVAATRSRTAKTAALAACLRESDASEVAATVAFLSGRVPQRRLGVGWRSLAELPPAAATGTLTVSDVDRAFQVLADASGPGSAGLRRDTLTALLRAASEPEQEFLRALITGNLRQGALDGVILQAIAAAYDLPDALVRRAAMLAGSPAAVAEAAAQGGHAAVAAIRLEVGRPIQPMLASSAKAVAEAVATAGHGRVLVDAKLDGIRLQVHRRAGVVSLYTRSLEDITERLPDVVPLIEALPGGDLVLDGEAIALRADGRPEPFQVTGARTASTADLEDLQTRVPLSTFIFDVMHRDGVDLLDQPANVRDEHLRELAPHLMVERLVTSDVGEAESFNVAALSRGHEGVVVKAADSTYAAGRRGSEWVKVKPVHTVDLVVLAVEWGSGRRRGWLSNLHLGARDEVTGELVMVGKTFKGMSDEMLRWQTKRFTKLASSGTDGWVVSVRPEQVVEIAFDGVQRSTRYAGGLALRFARVVRYREDKSMTQIDTLATLRRTGGMGAGA